mmetsp:Transcript_17597/g.38930  ORF Transcript_17597/g.38930 Transcript_17597/m.38930 type:complete len:179 (+) Transcript_17597:2-538(+)
MAMQQQQQQQNQRQEDEEETEQETEMDKMEVEPTTSTPTVADVDMADASTPATATAAATTPTGTVNNNSSSGSVCDNFFLVLQDSNSNADHQVRPPSHGDLPMRSPPVANRYGIGGSAGRYGPSGRIESSHCRRQLHRPPPCLPLCRGYQLCCPGCGTGGDNINTVVIVIIAGTVRRH